MKKLIIIAIMFTSINVFAQKKEISKEQQFFTHLEQTWKLEHEELIESSLITLVQYVKEHSQIDVTSIKKSLAGFIISDKSAELRYKAYLVSQIIDKQDQIESLPQYDIEEQNQMFTYLHQQQSYLANQF